MLNIFDKKKNYNYKPLNNENDKSLNNIIISGDCPRSAYIDENFHQLNQVDKNEYKNLIFYPSSTNE